MKYNWKIINIIYSIPNPKISFSKANLTASFKLSLLGKLGKSILLKQVCALIKFLSLILYSHLVIQNLLIFPLLDSNFSNPPIGTLELPVQKSKKLLNSSCVKLLIISQKLIIILSFGV